LSDGGIKQVKNDNWHHGKFDVEIYIKVRAEDDKYYEELNNDGRYGISHAIRNSVGD
jgi:hypothetical protein